MSGEEDNTPSTSSVQPKEESDVKEDAITLRVKENSGEETLFKVKKTTLMGKIFDAYSKRKSVPISALRFMLDGERIQADATPESLDLEDKDQIDVFLEQTGGR